MSHTNGNGHTNGRISIEPRNGHATALERRPPQNLEAERGVLGSVLLEGVSVLDEIAATLTADDFYRDTHQTIYRAMLALYAEGQKVDAVTVGDRLEATGEAAQVKYDDLIAELVLATPHAANARYYAAIVREKAIKRAVIEAATSMLRDGYSDDVESGHALERAERVIFEVSTRGTAGNLRRVEQVLPSVLDAIERRQRRAAPPGIASGFPDIDFVTGGFQPGQLIILAARPSMGKSALAWAMAEHAAAELGMPALFASLEMTAESLVERALSARARVDGHKIRTGYGLGHPEIQRIGAACNDLRPAPIFVDDTPAQSMMHALSTARRMKLRHGLAMYVLDYAQLCEPEDHKASRQEQVAVITRRLKAMARELEVPVIALSQLNRACEARPGHVPLLSDLRESGAIEQDADIVMLMHRPEFYDPNDQSGIAIVNVAKNRNGATDRVKLVFQKNIVRFDSEAKVAEPY